MCLVHSLMRIFSHSALSLCLNFNLFGSFFHEYTNINETNIGTICIMKFVCKTYIN